jgi:hypothetical protein
VSEYERFCQWFSAQNGVRPTRRDAIQAANNLEKIAEKRRVKAKFGGQTNKARDRAIEKADDLEDVAIALRASAPNAVNPCSICGDACAAYETKCENCRSGIKPPDGPGEAYLGPVFGS